VIHAITDIRETFLVMYANTDHQRRVCRDVC